MKFFFNIHVLVFTLLVFVLAVSCADVETETSGYAALEISWTMCLIGKQHAQNWHQV